MSILIGSAPDQVPVNGMLGSLAFQNKEFINIDNAYVTTNLGIGTTAPSYRIESLNTAGGSSIVASVIDGVGSTNFGYGFYIKNQSHEIAQILGNYTSSASGGSGELYFTTRNAGTLSERMRILVDGSIGIGTSTTSFSAGSGVVIKRTGTATLKLDSGSNTTELRGLTDSTQLFHVSSGYLALGTANTERVRIDASGRVTTPDMRLDTHIGVDNFTLFSQQRFIESGSTGLTLIAGSTAFQTFANIAAGTAPFDKTMYCTGIYEGSSDEFIPISPGETLYAEVWAYRVNGATGTAGTLYFGVEQYDKDQRVISSNSGLAYLVNAVTVPNTGVWTKYSGTITLAMTHTAYNNGVNASDGGPIAYVKPHLIVNYSSGTIPTYISGLILRRTALVRDSGNVGIGTSNATAALHVSAGSAIPAAITSSSTQFRLARVGTSGTKWGASADFALGTYAATLGASSQLDILLGNGNTNSPDTTVMTLLGSGNVGIGTTSPSKRLQIDSGSTATGGQAWSHSNGTIYARLGVVNPGTLNDTEFGAYSNNALALITNNTERMRIFASGNVAVNTTTDGGYNLQVNGSFAATSKSFLIDHPTKDGMKLRYGSLESPYHGVRLTGEDKLVNGKCTVLLPEYIKGLCKQDGTQVQITNIKHGKVIWINEIDIACNKFSVECDVSFFDNKEYKFYWSFTGIRKDIEDMLVEI